MPDFVYRKGHPVLDADGNVLYVQPVSSVLADDGIHYPGVYNPEGYVYNKYPNDFSVVRGNFITANGLNFMTVDAENFMVSGGEYNSIHTGNTIDTGITDIFNVKAEIEAKRITINNLITRVGNLEA